MLARTVCWRERTARACWQFVRCRSSPAGCRARPAVDRVHLPAEKKQKQPLVRGRRWQWHVPAEAGMERETCPMALACARAPAIDWREGACCRPAGRGGKEVRPRRKEVRRVRARRAYMHACALALRFSPGADRRRRERARARNVGAARRLASFRHCRSRRGRGAHPNLIISGSWPGRIGGIDRSLLVLTPAGPRAPPAGRRLLVWLAALACTQRAAPRFARVFTTPPYVAIHQLLTVGYRRR